MTLCQRLLFNILIACAARLYRYINIYHPDGEYVIGITMTNSEEYSAEISKIELGDKA